MDKEIVDTLIEGVAKVVKDDKLVEYEFLTGKNQIIILDEFDCDVDCRLYVPEYFERSLTLVVRDKATKNVVGKATIYVLDKTMWEKIEMWEKDGHMLHKCRLGECVPEYNKDLVVMGYGQIAHSIRDGSNMGYKRKIMEIYYTTLKTLMDMNEFIFYCEPCGVFSLSDSVIAKDELNIEDFNQDEIGKVNDESVVSQKLVKIFHMKQIPNYYHISTLGPIYIS